MNIYWLYISSGFLLSCFLHVTSARKEEFQESVKFDFLNNQQVHAFFNFSTTWTQSDDFYEGHYRLFPRPVGELVKKYNIEEFHFSLTQGLWRVEQWDVSPTSNPTGAQIRAWFERDTPDVDRNWVGFTNAISGIFCTSLSFINKDVTITPTVSFRPTGLVEDGVVDNALFRYGALVRENLCTENLTPWLKLLPCFSRAGVASLLKNPKWLHYNRYLSMNIAFKRTCHDPDCNEIDLNLEQHLSSVFDIREDFTAAPDFSISSIFGDKLKPACSVVDRSYVALQVLLDVALYPDLDFTKSEDGRYHILDLKSLVRESNLLYSWLTIPDSTHDASPSIFSQCHSSIQELDGRLICAIPNLTARNLTILFLQSMPWFLHAQFHTLKIHSDTNSKLEPLWKSFKPGKIRESPHVLELALELPANSVTHLEFAFILGFLKWTEHPPDANHGFYISPSVLSVRSADIELDSTQEITYIYGDSLLVSIPVPDFSMPYNVICMVCTIVAILFGSMHNISCRILMVKPAGQSNSPLGALVSKIKTRLTQLFSKKQKVVESTTSDKSEPELSEENVTQSSSVS